MNELFSNKIQSIYDGLMNCYKETQKYSPTITGAEREIFNRELFQKILPISYRVGAGTIVDCNNHMTGQIDAVIELPFSLSFPVSSNENRLFLADTIGAAFEIKSDLNVQWGDAINKIKEIKALNRVDVTKEKYNLADELKIPSFIISFKGPKDIETIFNKIGNLSSIDCPDGILIIEHGIFYGRAAGCDCVYEVNGDIKRAILTFISCLYKVLKRYSSNSAELDQYYRIL